jgi:predicted CoA-binding protein
MNTQETIDDFIAQRSLALVGVSRKKSKFGNMVLKELQSRGYRIFPIHREAQSIQGERCYPNLQSLPEPVGGVVLVVPPKETEAVVREAALAGFKRVWMQQGAESEAAIRFCLENSISVIYGKCILMYAPEVKSFHRIHRFFSKITGRLYREPASR